MAITQQDRREWAHHPVTQEFLKDLLESKAQTLDVWARGGYTAPTMAATVVSNANALGGVSVLQQLIEKIGDYQALEDSSVELVPNGKHL